MASSQYLHQWGLLIRPKIQEVSWTHWDLSKMATGLTFQNASSWIKMCIFWYTFQWILFFMVQITIVIMRPKWLGGGQTTRHYLNQWWPNLLTQNSVIRRHFASVSIYTDRLETNLDLSHQLELRQRRKQNRLISHDHQWMCQVYAQGTRPHSNTEKLTIL